MLPPRARPVFKVFDPKPDITVYELALIVANIAPPPGHPISKDGLLFDADQWDTLDPQLKRHFHD